MEREANAKLVAGALLVGASLLSGNAMLITAAGGVGVNWAPASLGELWGTLAPPALPGSALTRAYERALRRAVADLRKLYQAEHGKQANTQAFALVSAAADTLAQAQYSAGLGSAVAAQQALVRALDGLLHGHDAGQAAWIKARLLEHTALAFQHELAGDPEAWRMFHGWLIQQLAQASAALGQSLRDLPRVLEAIGRPVMLDAIDATTERLELLIAELRDELRRIAAGGAPSPARSHTQTIGGNAKVGVAISGDMHGNVAHQSGGVSYGSGNTISHTGDVVLGDKLARGDKVLGDKHEYHYGSPGLPAAPAGGTRQLLAAHRARLAVLKNKRAIYGYNAPAEVITEIESIEAEIVRLGGEIEP